MIFWHLYELNKPVAALVDTKGPEIRLKEFKNGVEMLEAGQTFTLTTARWRAPRRSAPSPTRTCPCLLYTSRCV